MSHFALGDETMNPIMDQYRNAKRQHPGTTLLFRMGDFYEAFDADAEKLGKVLGLTITRRGDAPMAGFPYHQLETYLHKLLAAGERVAICDRLEQVPELAKPDRVEVPKRRYNLSDLADFDNLANWLAQDGNPPRVQIETAASRLRWGATRYGGSRYETRTVSDAETAREWWSAYRRDLALEWAKSKLNTCKWQTHTQFIDECLRACGIKRGGTVAERVKRAIAARPDVYTDAETVRAREEAEHAELVRKIKGGAPADAATTAA